MDDPDTPATNSLADLRLFEATDSPDGRLLHYAKGRIRSFWLRQTLTFLGVLTIYLLASAELGMILAALTLAGEVVDIVLLRRVIRRLEHGLGGRATRWLAMLGSTFQGATIAACVALCWYMIPLFEARFFAVAFLIGAAINAGLGRPHFKPAADMRLLIFLATAFMMMARDLTQFSYATSREYGFFASAFGLLVYISLLFIRLLEKSYEQRRRHEFTLLKQQHAQEIAQEKLAQSMATAERLALVAKYANDSIVISATDGRIEWVNDAFTRITGYGFDEAVGKHPSEILNAPETDTATLERLLHARETRSPARVEILNRAKSGRLMWVEVSMIPIRGESGDLRMWISVEREISEAKEREEELARARTEAEEAGKSKSRFLANMSHEIRTPMNGVIGVAELLAETEMTPLQANYVETIRESGKALLGIINDILDLAKLQSGKATLELLPFSPVSCVESVLRILGPAAAKKGVALRLEAPATDAFVTGDEGKLRQIVLNLVGNALKFTADGAVTVSLRLPVAPDDLLVIAISDTGIGIAQDRIAAIFDSFSQADNAISRQYGGTGLGLTICAMLAAEMGGKIEVRSELGKGSEFTLSARLPLTNSRPVAVLPERRALPRLRPGLRVLVAEDNRTNMMIVRKMLQGVVLSVAEAPNGEEAVRLYTDCPPDVILMDMSMPVKDGLQATRDIRAHETAAGLGRCPVIALTANAFGEDREACRLAGFDGFLVKPLSRADLLSAIAEYCPDTATRQRAIGL
jgi:two-component system, sensor histidine kinase